jgi:23S rRNA pseudouridine2605 synthase
MAEERLQKILSRAGIASRRHAEELIQSGVVAVNGRIVTELGTKAELGRDYIKVNGKLIRPPRQFVYYALNKPREYVTTVTDPQGRRTVMDLLKHVKERVYPVGRLDYHSEGLLLFTNDGDFANAVLSAKNEVPKTYVVKTNGPLTPEQEEEFRAGVPLHGRKTAPAGLKLIRSGKNPWYEVKLVEGRQNQIRLMFKYFDRLVEKLRRVKVGFLELGTLKPGEFRTLTPREVERFRKLLHLEDPDAERS